MVNLGISLVTIKMLGMIITFALTIIISFKFIIKKISKKNQNIQIGNNNKNYNISNNNGDINIK